MSLSLTRPNQKMLTPAEEAELIAEWASTHSEAALMRLMRAFSPLVAKYVRKYAAYGISKEELLSVGNLALLESVHKFEPEKECKFSTYSSRCVQGTLLVYIASNYFAFALKSGKIKKVFFKLRRAVHEQQRVDKNADLRTIMEKLSPVFKMPATRLEQIYDMIQHPITSVQQPVYTRDDLQSAALQYGDLLPSDEPDPEASLVDKKMVEFRRTILVTTMAEVLNERERIIISGRMLAKPSETKTLQHLADTFNLSRERVRQISNIALEKLQRAIRAKCPDMEPESFFD